MQDENGHTYITNCLDHQHQHQHKDGATKTKTQTRKNDQSEELGQYEYGGVGAVGSYSGEDEAAVAPAEDQGYDSEGDASAAERDQYADDLEYYENGE